MAIKKYGRTVNIFDDTNIIEIPNVGDRYGVIVPSGTYSIYNGTDNIVYYGRDNWTARSPACQPHTTATITLNVGSGGGFFMPYNSASQGGCTIVVGETPPDHYIPYRDWLVHGYKKYGTETETFTTLPHEVIGDGQSNLTWSMDGNMQVNGTPTPQNPITPAEVGEKTANLWDEQTLEGYYTSTGTFNSVSGQLCTKNKIAVKPNTAYFLGVPSTQQNAFLAVSTYDSAGTFISRDVLAPYVGSGVSYTTNSGTFYININFSTYYGGTYRNNVIICEGAEKTYEPYGYKIPISFNGVSYPIYLSEPIRKIGDSVDTAPSTGTATKIIKKLVLTGNETAASITQTTDGNNYCIAYKYSDLGMTDIMNYDEYTYQCDYPVYVSSHFTMKSITGLPLPNDYNDIAAGEMGANTWKPLYDKPETFNRYIIFCVSGITTIADFRAWLSAQYAAGTPVTIWYVLATTTTETFTAPTIPTSGTAQSFDVDTTLKPSEVSLTYHGWHDHTDTKFTT